MADTGFLDQMGLISRAQAEAVDEQQRVGAFSRANQQGAAFGRQAAPLLGAGIGGVAGLFNSEGRSLKGFARNAGEAASRVRDANLARAVGQDVDTFRSNQRIRDKAARQNFGDPSTLEARIKMAEFIAKEAMNDGNFDARTKALAQLDALRKEKQQFDRLAAQERRAEKKSITDDVVDIYLKGEEVPVAAQRRIENGKVVYDYTRGGKLKTARPGEFSFENPADAKSGETLDQRFRRVTSSGEVADARQQLIAVANAVPRFRRVMENVMDLSKQGGAEIVLSDSGKAVGVIDRAVRNVRGFGSAILSIGSSPENSRLKTSVLERANNLDDSIWDIDMPEEFKRAAAASDQFRANIMELAYLAARMAEPSNRGLSDNDVQNALQRLAANSSNPQTILRRFAEIVANGASDTERIVGLYSGILGEENKAGVEQILGGSLLPKYRRDLAKLYDDFGITIDADSDRATFAEEIDADVQPGEGVPEPTATGPADLDDDAFLDTVLGPQ